MIEPTLPWAKRWMVTLWVSWAVLSLAPIAKCDSARALQAGGARRG